VSRREAHARGDRSAPAALPRLAPMQMLATQCFGTVWREGLHDLEGARHARRHTACGGCGDIACLKKIFPSQASGSETS